VNGVAMQHGKVSREMFPDYEISAITNGVHAGTWTGPAFHATFDRHLPRWRQDNLALRYAIDIPEEDIAASDHLIIFDKHFSYEACDVGSYGDHVGADMTIARPRLVHIVVPEPVADRDRGCDGKTSQSKVAKNSRFLFHDTNSFER